MSKYAQIIELKINKDLLREAKKNGWAYPEIISDKDRTCPSCKALHDNIDLEEGFFEVHWVKSLCKDCKIKSIKSLKQRRKERTIQRRILKAGFPRRSAAADYKTLTPALLKKLRSFDLKDGLWIIGDYQVGKTWAAVAYLKLLASDNIIKFCLFSSLIKSDIKTNTDLFEEVRDFPGIVLLDDVTNITSEFWRYKLEDIITHRFAEFLPIIYTTNISFDKLPEILGERIFFRLRKAKNILNFDKEFHYEV